MSKISIDVQRKTIEELVTEDVKSGKYWLPSFQRRYVWNPDDIKMLIDSIVSSYPIGSIILWKPSHAQAAAKMKIEKSCKLAFFVFLKGLQSVTSQTF